jgi:hypothetical protein
MLNLFLSRSIAQIRSNQRLKSVSSNKIFNKHIIVQIEATTIPSAIEGKDRVRSFDGIWIKTM